MTPQQYQRVVELFEEAIVLEPSQRGSFLLGACGSDAESLRVLRAMIDQHGSPSTDLDEPVLDGRLDLAALNASVEAAPEVAIPRNIGPFTITGVLGSGGMSVVYRARQEFPDREVALKVMRSGEASRQAIERFRGEVQVLARLSHPSIAQIHEAGFDREGDQLRPWFAMELIDGQPLVQYATVQQLHWREQLRLMIEVCRAVQHAHLRGVIHRDLKPSNIMVTADGRPMVLDFGIARVVEAERVRTTLQTQQGQLLGTLPYMSPEQLAGDVDAVDLRSDVYALGVVLHELLTGALPHDVAGATITTALRRLVESEPRRLGAANRAFRGELEAIVSTAMERDRGRRYQSAAALADDLAAFLEHRPILARAPSLTTRARKWSRRHPTASISIALGIVAIGALFAVIAWERRQDQMALQRQREEAWREADAAVQQFVAEATVARQWRRDLADLRKHQLYRYHPHDEALALEQRERELLQRQREHEARFHQTRDALARAEQLGADPAAAKRLAALLYLARAREAEAAGERVEREVALEQVRRLDSEGKLSEAMIERDLVEIDSNPPGAEVHLFRMIEQSELDPLGEPRVVPVPVHGGELPITPGTIALRVVDGRGVLDAENLILELDGRSVKDLPDAVERCRREGGAAAVWRNDRVEQVNLPAGLDVRTTARPLFIGAGSRVGIAPLSSLRLERGNYLAVLLREGCEPVRAVFQSSPRVPGHQQAVVLDMQPAGATPAGFVWVSCWTHRGESFWIMEHEVTAGQYLEFLNDPETQAVHTADADAGLVPRLSRVPQWPRGADGLYRLPEPVSPDWPVFYVSWHDARAYAQRRTRTARAAGLDVHFDLPSHGEWLTAWGSNGENQFPWGMHFRPWWTSSNYARSKPSPEPVMSYPVDESTLGVFDLGGSMSEWLHAWWLEERDHREVAGGSWAHGGFNYREMFMLYGPNGAVSTTTSGTFGFRLVMRPGPPRVPGGGDYGFNP